ncbi:MAG: universal stress protein [Gammaproteobacteria bacterium]
MADKINEILVPVDGSENSIRAARFAMRLAGALDIGVRLFYVFPAVSVELVGMTGMSSTDIEHAGETSGRRAFDAVEGALKDELVDQVEHQVALGDPAEEIIAYTDKNPAVLVVMGRRGLSRMRTLLLGSVSDKVTRHAKCPVTIVT